MDHNITVPDEEATVIPSVLIYLFSWCNMSQEVRGWYYLTEFNKTLSKEPPIFFQELGDSLLLKHFHASTRTWVQSPKPKKNSWAEWCVSVISVLGRWRQEHLLGLLISQLSLLGNPKPRRDTVSKNKVGVGDLPQSYGTCLGSIRPWIGSSQLGAEGRERHRYKIDSCWGMTSKVDFRPSHTHANAHTHTWTHTNTYIKPKTTVNLYFYLLPEQYFWKKTLNLAKWMCW